MICCLSESSPGRYYKRREDPGDKAGYIMCQKEIIGLNILLFGKVSSTISETGLPMASIVD